MEKIKNRPKILSIVGARPQFVKLAPICRNITKYKNIEHVVCHTGQHYDRNMSKVFFNELGLNEPKYNLNIGSGSHGSQTGIMLEKIEKVLLNERPDMVIIFGDTNTTLAGAIASAKLKIKSLHIEAGLRSFNKSMPEEINRVVSDHVCDYLFAPTKTALNNLKNEGLYKNVFVTGDIMSDVLFDNIKKIKSVKEKQRDKYYLLTLHRPYNVDDTENLFRLLNLINSTEVKTIFPMHPRTRSKINENISFNNIIFIEPQSYLDFLRLHINSEKVITDSGGVQKEAYLLKKPCITLRSETEWVETVDSGWNLLVNKVNKSVPELINDFKPPSKHPNIFGKNVAEKMVNTIIKFL